MIIKDIDNKEEWDNFFLFFDKRTFLNSWNWGEFRMNLGSKIWRKAVIKDGRIQALFLISKINSKKGSFLLLSHCPLSLCKESFKEAMEETISIAKKERVVFIRIAPIFNYEDIFNDLGFKISPSSVFPVKSLELNLIPDEDVILSGMRKSTRYLIKKELKDKSIKVLVSDDINDLDLFYNLQNKTAKKQGFKPFSYNYLKNEFETFLKDDQVRLVLGYHDQKCIAAAFIIFWGGKAFYHHGASILSKVPVSYLVQWEAIREAKRRGCEQYNFWAIAPSDDPNHRWSGLTRFKKGFGGKEIEYSDTVDLPLSRRYLLTYWFDKLKG